MASGYAIAVAFGLALGLLLGISPWAQRLVAPTFHGVRQIAPFAWIPLLSAWTGTGESTKVAFIAVASFAPTVLGTMEGARSVASGHKELARILEVGTLPFIRDVVLPSAMPGVLSGLHMSLVSAWLATVGAEFFLQVSPGLTGILMEGRALTRMDIVVFGLVVIASVGFGLSAGMAGLERYALRWRPRRNTSNV
jgi:sulfonate transport system permease protein